MNKRTDSPRFFSGAELGHNYLNLNLKSTSDSLEEVTPVTLCGDGAFDGLTGATSSPYEVNETAAAAAAAAAEPAKSCRTS